MNGNHFRRFCVVKVMKNTLLVALVIESVLNLGFAQQLCTPTVVRDLRIEQFESKMYGKK